jgi:rod shape determining protein RodA
MAYQLRGESKRLGLGSKLQQLSWGMIVLVCAIAGLGILLLYSAGGGSWDRWASSQVARFGFGLAVMIIVATVDLRFWMRFAYPIYGLIFLLLIVVEVMGHVGMGAERWINLGFLVIQPSELMKIALVLAMARYFHGFTLTELRNPLTLVVPILMILAPVGMVLMQPNLGTATLLTLTGAAVAFGAGVPVWIFAVVIGLGLAAIPVGWEFLHDYQRQRVYTFLDPGSDPLGAGYNIMQSKIALGSGGLFGKGFMEGTQSQLAFLPEKHTDFIFVVLAEEFGMVGALLLLFLYALLLVYGVMIAVNAQSQFGRLVALGLTTTFFLYVFVNVAMVTGLIPVVGIPLPLVSYGGTAMLTLLIGCGLLMNVWIHRDVRIPRAGNVD